ncbi:unnamed protein product [Notodromas monacha]|uniref:Uncharacterized protein n=1 Tax=Notodromas monacha TaxID=399045 RepID=A0A7R9G7Y2_9CRUS|nr:unnamed protein product [Notodromas monacha]CAG0912546.1 unnamed protein product [Notodromas monacha]
MRGIPRFKGVWKYSLVACVAFNGTAVVNQYKSVHSGKEDTFISSQRHMEGKNVRRNAARLHSARLGTAKTRWEGENAIDRPLQANIPRAQKVKANQTSYPRMKEWFVLGRLFSKQRMAALLFPPTYQRRTGAPEFNAVVPRRTTLQEKTKRNATYIFRGCQKCPTPHASQGPCESGLNTRQSRV